MSKCNLCIKSCNNDWCAYGDKMSKFNDLIEELKWATIYNEKDMRKAYNLGREDLLNELKLKVRGKVVNGTVQGIITEDDLNEVLESSN